MLILRRAVRTKVVKWDADEAFVPAKDTDFESNTTLATWNTLMPQGTGWRHTETETTFFTTTMTHQLHCIVSVHRRRDGPCRGADGGETWTAKPSS